MAQQAFDVKLGRKVIDTVFYSAGAKVSADEVRRSLIDHDGYDHRITVSKRRARKNPATSTGVMDLRRNPAKQIRSYKSIIVKYQGPTNTKGAGWKVTDSEGRFPMRQSREYGLNAIDDAASAARAFAEKMGWSGTYYAGSASQDAYVFVIGDASSKAFTVKAAR